MNSVRVTVKLLENQRLSQLLLKSNYILMTCLTFHDYISHFSESIMLAKLRVVVAAMEVSRTKHVVGYIRNCCTFTAVWINPKRIKVFFVLHSAEYSHSSWCIVSHSEELDLSGSNVFGCCWRMFAYHFQISVFICWES